MIYHDCQALNNVPLRVKICIKTFNMFDSDYEMTCSVTLNYVSYNLNKIYLTTTILIEFTSTYYDYYDDYFAMLFHQYTA